MTKSTGSDVYASVAKKHPDWSQVRVYAVTRNILARMAEQENAKAKAAAKTNA